MIHWLHTHHQSRDVCLRGVWGQVHLLGGTGLVFGVDHDAVAREALQASQSVFLTRPSPAHNERGGTDLRELDVGGWRDGCGEVRE